MTELVFLSIIKKCDIKILILRHEINFVDKYKLCT